MGTATTSRPAVHPAADAAPWWRGATIYQVYPRSFRDTTGDGVGDLRGIIDGLDHIASLGVDAVWLSPFFTSPMRDYGYDVADYLDVDPIFGTLQDFDDLVARAHALGLKIIIDQVYSHTSDAHAWFQDSRSGRDSAKADWYVWADAKPDGSPPSNWQSVFGGPAWEWDARRKQYYLHNFLKEQPQLNVHNRAVQDTLLDIARFWLDRGVDGFRLDAINFAMHDRTLRDNPPSHLPMELVTRPFDMQDKVNNQSQPEIPAFLERIRAVLDTYGDRFTVAEVGGPAPLAEMKMFTEGERRLNSAYSFDFLYAEDLTAEAVKASLGDWSDTEGEGWPSWAFSNHDAPRAVSRWARGHDTDQVSRLLMLLLLSLRGNPFIYQGEELGLPQAHVPFEHLKDPEAIANWPLTLGRDGARTPFPWMAQSPSAGFSDSETTWLPMDADHGTRAADRQRQDPASCLNVTRGLIALRKALPPVARGALEFIDAPDGVLAFRRTLPGHVPVTCVYNFAGPAQNWQPPGASQLRVVASGTGAAAKPGAVPGELASWSGYWAVDGDE